MTNQQTAKFEDFLTPADKGILVSKTHQKAEPVYIRKLVDATGSQKIVSEYLGLSPSAISSILSEKETVVPNELAARYIWEQKFSAKASELGLAFISAEKHQLQTIKDLVSGLGGTFQYIEAGKGK